MKWFFAPVFVCLFASAAAAAAAADGLSMGTHDSSAPIAVSADNFTGDFATKVGTYIGNVLISQGDFKIRADKVTILVQEGKPNRIEAKGNVVFAAPSGSASGDDGVYDLGPRTITLTGRVVLSKEKNVMRGTRLVINLATGKALLGAKGAPGGRVQGLFTPPPQTKSNGDN